MFLIQKRGTRMNSDWCTTSYPKFYPVCYTQDEDTLAFGPNVLPGHGEEKFDAAKAAAQDAGATGEEFCLQQNPTAFCTKCIRPQWFDARISIFSEEPTCLQCISMCVNYFTELDRQAVIANKVPSNLGCYVCMHTNPDKTNNPFAKRYVLML